MRSETTSPANPDAPVVLLLTDKTSGKSPLTVAFQGSRSFDPNGGSITFAWDFRDGRSSSTPDTTVIFSEVGSRWVTLSVTDPQGLVMQDSIRIEVVGNGTSFLGRPPVIPTVIEAEAYDLGGEGTAYHDADANNIGLAYRPNEGVDIESGPNGFDVYWITAGEWMEWTFEVAEAGMFTFAPSVASVPGFGSFRMLIDNVDVSGVRPVRGTGGWQFWRPIEVRDIELEAGVHILRLEFDSATDKTGWLFSLNSIAVTRQAEVGVEDRAETRQIELAPMVPNPARSSARINYALANAAPVTLEVFNSLGQRVAVLVDGPRLPGAHSVVLDTAELASGVYLIRLSTPEASVTRTLVRL
jgi:PKD repeat protein